MSATKEDVCLARDVADPIVAAGYGRVRRVALVGSRAIGTARTNSDLDLVVLVELPAGTRPWGAAECLAERDRITRTLRPMPIKAELWLRTLDQYEDFRRVECTFEWRVESEGIEIYRSTAVREGVTTRSLDVARRETVLGWASHAMQALTEAWARENRAALSGVVAPVAAQRASLLAVIRAVTALLVRHRIHASKHNGTDEMLARLSTSDHEIATRLRSYLEAHTLTARVAHGVLLTVVRDLTQTYGMVPVLERIQRRLEKPVVFLSP